MIQQKTMNRNNDGRFKKHAKLIECTCLLCKSKFHIKESSLKYGRGKYCSRKCCDIHKKETYSGKLNPMYGKSLSKKHRQSLSEKNKIMWKSETFRNNVKRGQERYIKNNGHWPGSDAESVNKRKNTMLKRYGIEHNWNGEFGKRKCDISTIIKYKKTSIELATGALNKTKITSIEKKMMSILKSNNIKFKRNYRIMVNKRRYRVYDFYIPHKNILIECDGDYWHGNPKICSRLNETQIKNKQNDLFKNELAEIHNYKLLRFWESDILSNEFEESFLSIINE